MIRKPEKRTVGAEFTQSPPEANHLDPDGILYSMMQPLAGYQEIAHTADWELHVWAPDMPALLEQAARGTYALMAARLQSAPRQSRCFEIYYQDKESLLSLSWLSCCFFVSLKTLVLIHSTCRSRVSA